MFYVGFFIGVLTAGLSSALPLYLFYRRSLDPKEEKGFGFPISHKRKKTPKSISEEEIWQREQKAAPLDPTL